MCDNVSYNWAAVLASLPGQLRQIWIWLWGEAGSYWRIMRGGGPVRQNYGYDGWLGWAGCSGCCAQLSSAPGWLSLYSSLRWAGHRGAQCRCAGLSLPLWGSAVAPRSGCLVSLSSEHNIAMIWDQCAGRLYTRALPISVLTVPYDSCKLPPASCCYHRLYSDKKEMTRLLWSRHLHKLLKTSFLENLRSEECKLSFNQTLRSSEKSVYEA